MSTGDSGRISGQEPVETIADLIGASVKDVLKATRQLDLDFEPAQRELDKSSFLRTDDIPDIKNALGLLSDAEKDLFLRMKESDEALKQSERTREWEKSYRKENLKIGAILLLPVTIVLISLPQIVGFIFGTHNYRGLTLPGMVRLIPELVSFLWWLLTRPVTLVLIAVLGVCLLAFYLFWLSHADTRAELNRKSEGA